MAANVDVVANYSHLCNEKNTSKSSAGDFRTFVGQTGRGPNSDRG